jgi:uncharacterized membrane protein
MTLINNNIITVNKSLTKEGNKICLEMIVEKRDPEYDANPLLSYVASFVTKLSDTFVSEIGKAKGILDATLQDKQTWITNTRKIDIIIR